jgi:starch synthase (maltosyl-transferring)
LFPKLYKNTEEWEKNIKKIAAMGFNSIYINPFHYPGFSGSLYAPKDYYLFNENFFTNKSSPEEQLASFIKKCSESNIGVFMDLVINHTSIDSPLIKDHKNWYILENGDVKRPGAWENGQYVTWGDLATFNLESSEDRDNLWDYLLNVCKYYLKLGFKGFRCDAAYQVPSEFWSFVIPSLKKLYPDILFLAETLGCTPIQIQTLSSCGFDYIFNSSKWWNFNDSWCLEQYNITKDIAPSISFPESHDTPRLMADVNKNINAFLQRLYFEAIFSKGFMITTGFEFGFLKAINTVDTTPADWEDTGTDFSDKIKKILSIKDSLLPLKEESPIQIVDQSNWMNVFCFIKEWNSQKVLIILNKDVYKNQKIVLNNLNDILKSEKIKDYSPEDRIKGYIHNLDFELSPGELKIFASENIFCKK